MCSSYLATWLLLASSMLQVESDSPSIPTVARQTVILVVGASGEEEYGDLFRQSADHWEEIAKAAPIRCVRIGNTSPEQPNQLAQLETTLAAEPKDDPEPIWIVMLGHGTFDGRQAKFNLRGPDLTAEQLAQWLKPFQRTLIIVNCASASSPFMNQLAGENRVIITSTKSGYQYNFARFGAYISQTIGDVRADLDKDGQTSLLEAYLMASSRVDEFYRQESRLATEEALLDDNGDGLGTPASWFRGVRAVKKPKDGGLVDGTRAHQLHLVRTQQEQNMPAELRARRDELEKQLAALRETKAQLEDNPYYERLLPVMIQLAQLYESAQPPAQPAD